MAKKDYEVGYGKPPKHTRFKKGQSGNPKGRPKGRKNMATLIHNALERRVIIKEDGRLRTVPFSEAFVAAFVKKAINGTTKDMVAATKTMHDYAPETFEPQDLTNIVIECVDADDGRLLTLEAKAAWKASGLADDDDSDKSPVV